MADKNRYNITLHPIINDLVRSESIVTKVSVKDIIQQSLVERYTNGTLVHKKLNWIMNNMKNSDKIPKEWMQDRTLFDIPKVSLEEIDASVYVKKRKYVKKAFVEKGYEPTEKVRNVFEVPKFG